MNKFTEIVLSDADQCRLILRSAAADTCRFFLRQLSATSEVNQRPGLLRAT